MDFSSIHIYGHIIWYESGLIIVINILKRLILGIILPKKWFPKNNSLQGKRTALPKRAHTHT